MMDIKENIYEINLMESPEMDVLTEEITGMLHSLIINSTNLIRLSICTEEGIELYTNLRCSGIMFVPLRMPNISPHHELLNYSSSCFPLKDKLKIHVEGLRNTSVIIKLRYC